MTEEVRQQPVHDLEHPWWVDRLHSDVWSFWVVLSSGQSLLVECLDKLRRTPDGTWWADFRLHEAPSIQWAAECAKKAGMPPPAWAPTSRTECSVNVAHIVYVVEACDT